MSELERKRDRAPVPAAWDYAPAPEARDLVQLREQYGLFVGGEWLEPIEVYTFAMLVYFFILFPVTRGVDIFYQRVAHQGRS